MKIPSSDSSTRVKLLATLGLKRERVQGWELQSLSTDDADRDPVTSRGSRQPSQERRGFPRAAEEEPEAQRG